MRGCFGGRAWLLGGACMVALGGDMCGCSRGACVVAPRGHAWLLLGGMHGCCWGGMCGCSGGMCGIRRDTEIRSMSGRYASYWNAFLLVYYFLQIIHPDLLQADFAFGSSSAKTSPPEMIVSIHSCS